MALTDNQKKLIRMYIQVTRATASEMEILGASDEAAIAILAHWQPQALLNYRSYLEQAQQNLVVIQEQIITLTSEIELLEC